MQQEHQAGQSTQKMERSNEFRYLGRLNRNRMFISMVRKRQYMIFGNISKSYCYQDNILKTSVFTIDEVEQVTKRNSWREVSKKVISELKNLEVIEEI